MEIEITVPPTKYSNLQYNISTYNSTTTPADILIISFSGNYGFGSLGNSDAIFMETVNQAALKAYPAANTIIYDLTQMSYEWGDAIDRALGGNPFVIVVSDLNRVGLTSLMEEEWLCNPAEWLFETKEAAIDYLEQGVKNQVFVKHNNKGERSFETILEAGRLVKTLRYRRNKLWIEEIYYSDKYHRIVYNEDGEISFEKDFEL